jgi:hypothetical protein
MPAAKRGRLESVRNSVYGVSDTPPNLIGENKIKFAHPPGIVAKRTFANVIFGITELRITLKREHLAPFSRNLGNIKITWA